MGQQAKFWEIDRRLETVASDPAWARFHRRCGDVGVFFAVERKDSRAWPKGYTVAALRYEKSERADYYRTIEIAEVSGSCPRETLVAAFHAARASADLTAQALPVTLVADLERSGQKPSEPQPRAAAAASPAGILAELGL